MTTDSLAPVAPAERVETIDILRGLALFGILAANIRGFAGPAATYFMPDRFWPALHDRLAQAFIDTFVQHKFLTIFAFLFGVGFAVQFERAQGRRFAWTYTRRLLILIAVGLVHGLLIWFGDILLVYGLVGLLLLFFRKRADKTLLVWALVGLLVPLLLMVVVFAVSQFGTKMPPMPVISAAALAKLQATFSSGTWMEIQQQRMRDAVRYNWGFLPMFFWQVAALFLLGMLAWRRRLLQPAPESLPRYRRVMAWALIAGITANAAATLLRWFFHPAPMPTSPVAMLTSLLMFAGGPTLSLGYILLVVVLCSDPAWKARLRRFGAVGRTALTNYLLQSVIGTLLFYSYGFGLFGKLGPALLLPVTVVLFAAQVALSAWWVSRFRFGPMEWLWRSLTYGRHFALVEASTPSVPATPAERPAL